MAGKVTVPEIRKMKQKGEKITALTAYDYSFARILDEAGVDILLVGDSLGSVIQGLESTLPVTLDEMIYHTKTVVRGRKRALVVAAMSPRSSRSVRRDVSAMPSETTSKSY